MLTVDRYGRIMAKAEVQAPGSRGGQFHHTKAGRVRYGVMIPHPTKPGYETMHEQEYAHERSGCEARWYCRA